MSKINMLEVGKTYRTRGGSHVIIIIKSWAEYPLTGETNHYFIGDNGIHYTTTGQVKGINYPSPSEIVELVEMVAKTNDQAEPKTDKPAFPFNAPNGGPILPSAGMTLREYFAAHCPINLDTVAGKFLRDHRPGHFDEVLDLYAEVRFKYADAMIKALGGEQK